MTVKHKKKTTGDLVSQIWHLDASLNSARNEEGEHAPIGMNNMDLADLVRFMEKVLTEKDSAYEIRKSKRGEHAHPVSSLASYFKLMPYFIGLYSRDLSYAPQIQLFFDCYIKHDIRHCLFASTAPTNLSAVVFDDFIQKLREEGKRIRIHKKIADWERNPNKNAERLTMYEEALFKKYARLMVVRVDLLYKKAIVRTEDSREMAEMLQARAAMDNDTLLMGNESAQSEHETLARVDIKEAMRDRERLFDNMRSKPTVFKHLVGFVWSLEWSRAGGYHCHCAFFFDGSKVHKHEYLADLIGKYWETTITRGRGYHYNCNREKAKYGDDWGIGMVNHDEYEKRTKLMRALTYLAKKDQFVYVTPSEKCKRFGTGHMPQPKSAAGRPRNTAKAG